MNDVTERFYAELPVGGRFEDVVEDRLFRDVPPDWQVIVADVRGSTAAIAEGRYKDVNLVGASCIVAALNAAKGVALPFVFGGDGANLVVPPTRLEPVARALVATKALASRAFGLELRVGGVRVATLAERGAWVRVAKIRMSDHYEQAMFAGGGLACAEALVKDPAGGAHLLQARAGEEAEADYSGLECRWQDLRSPRGEVHSVLVRSTGACGPEDRETYREVLAAVRDIYGAAEEWHPVAPETLRLSFSPLRLAGEARIRGTPVWKLMLANALGSALFASGAKAFGTDWSRYKPDLRANADVRKFDEMLRMVLGGSPDRRAAFEAFLRARLDQGRLVYGLHHAPHALVTCLVFNRDGHHLHFVDGGNGGYALAAKQMKAQLAQRTARAA